MSERYRVHVDADLARLNTFGVAAVASTLIELHDGRALPEVLALPALAGQPPLVIGGGSNLLFAGPPAQAVLRLVAQDIRILDEHDGSVRVRADAGAIWHELVMWTLQQGLSGLQNLALIPGTVGAAPIQNIGAYGVEVGEYIDVVEALDCQSGQPVRLSAAECHFAYRDSLFKQDVHRYIVTAVEFLLPRQAPLRLDYAGIGDELQQMGIDHPTAEQVAMAVIRIRQRKLPDPAVIGNAGSFFKNPLVPTTQAEALQAAHPGLPVFRGNTPEQRKVSAAWMIEQCGWKGYRDGDAGVAASHALVLVNHGHASGAQLLDLARRIADSVYQRFGVAIEPEPRLIGAHW